VKKNDFFKNPKEMKPDKGVFLIVIYIGLLLWGIDIPILLFIGIVLLIIGIVKKRKDKKVK
jgi:hypothetical protein